MGLVPVYLHTLFQVLDNPVDPYLHKALLRDLFEQFPVMPFSRAHGRGQNVDAFSGEIMNDQVADLPVAVAHHFLARIVAVGIRGPGIEQAQKVINLGDGSDGGTGRARSSLLLDGDYRGKPVNLVHVRALKPPEKLAGIGRKRLDVTTLPFGVYGIEGEGGFAASRKAGNHHQFFARNADVYVLEIMDPRTLYVYTFFLLVHPCIARLRKYAFSC